MNIPPEPPPSVPHAGETHPPSLLRVLGPGMAMAMVVGSVIGSGIFAKPGAIATAVGNFPVIISVWVLGGLICLLGALCFAELSAMLPRAGGMYVFLREAYGRPAGFLFGFNEFVFGRPASIGALAVFFVVLLYGICQNVPAVQALLGDPARPGVMQPLRGAYLALAIIGAMAWVNVMGVIWGGRVQGLTTLIKAGFLGLIGLLPFLLALSGVPSMSFANYATTITPAETTLPTQFAAALLAVMWAYNGWHDIAPVAEEVRNPQRNIPLALIGGVGVLIVLYVLANCAYHGVLSMSAVSQADDKTAQVMVRTMLQPFGFRMAELGVGLMSAVILCSIFGALNANLLLGPRIAFAMGRDDVFVRQLGMVHPRYHTPAVAIVVQATMTMLLVLASALLVTYVPWFRESKTTIFGMLTDFVTFSANIFYLMCVVAVCVLRWKHPEWDRPYRTWGYPVVPAVYTVIGLWFLYEVYWAKPFESNVGLILILAGLPVYYLWQLWVRARGAAYPRG